MQDFLLLETGHSKSVQRELTEGINETMVRLEEYLRYLLRGQDHLGLRPRQQAFEGNITNTQSLRNV